MLECYYWEEEAREEAIVNNVISAEIGNNFQVFSSWARRYGIAEALHRQEQFEKELLKERERLVEIRRVRQVFKLRTKDIIECIRNHRRINYITNQMLNLKHNPCSS